MLLAAILLALSTGLLLQGYARHEVGLAGTALLPPAQPGVVSGGGSVLYRSAQGLSSRGLPARTVALTFDDGPDPVWTPRILAVLNREKVPATFFEVGARVASFPNLTRRILADGDELGSHTFTHADLSTLPGWRENLELSLSQLAFAGSTGRATVLLRPPYSATAQDLSHRDVQVVSQATAAGYIVVLADRDSEDWRRPGVALIVRNALPQGDDGAIIMFHDAGGDRSQTVAALPTIIERLRARGYRFTTVTGGLGLPANAGVQPVPWLRRAQGDAFLTVLRLSTDAATLLTWLLLPLGALALLRTVLLLVLARRHSRAVARRTPREGYAPPVSVIVPAYNEAVGIAASVRSLVANVYPVVEVIVVDDGSTDGTADIVDALALPGVTVVRQANQGKAAALNTGLAHASHDVIVMVDGDTLFDVDTIRWLVQPLADPIVGAVSGNTKVGNRRHLLGQWQHLEYVIGFNLDRRMYDLLWCMPTVPGAIGAYRRDALEAVGGVSGDTLAEDTDLTMAINRFDYRVVYEERALAWTEAPASLNALWRQRYRWCYGTLQAVWKHRAAMLSRGAGRELGQIGLPYLVAFQVVLPLLAPIIDVFALYGLLFLDARKVLAYWGAFLLLQLISGIYALRLDRERMRPLWALPLQQFVYRQLMYLVVIQSVISAMSGVRLRWHKLDRTGDVIGSVPGPRASIVPRL